MSFTKCVDGQIDKYLFLKSWYKLTFNLSCDPLFADAWILRNHDKCVMFKEP